MDKKIIVTAMLTIFLLSGMVNAQADVLVVDGISVGLTPASPFFFMERFFEGIGTLFTFGEANKARRYLALAEERLAETRALAEEQDGENTIKAAELYERELAKSKERVSRVGEIDLEAYVTDATTRHLSVLDDVIIRAPEQAREQLMAAKERTMSGQIEALRGIAQHDPETAIDIFARAAEGRLRAAEARASAGSDGDEEAEDVAEALDEYNEYAEFGKEISVLAAGLQTGETTVEELVERATSHHLDILRSVQSRVPAEAQESIQGAIEDAERVRNLRPAIPSRQDGDEPESTDTDAIPADVRGLVPSSAGQGDNNETSDDNGVVPEGAPQNLPIAPGPQGGRP